MNGKTLRVVTGAAQQVGAVLQQNGADGDEVEAVTGVLKQVPFEGQVVSLDAGLLQRRAVKTVVAKQGAPLAF